MYPGVRIQWKDLFDVSRYKDPMMNPLNPNFKMFELIERITLVLLPERIQLEDQLCGWVPWF